MTVAAQQVPPAGTLVLDHISHFVPDLRAARRALEDLGFVVTPESAQVTQEGPAGTSNICVMLEHGYLEILAPTMDTPNARRLQATMDRYPGVHLACFGTPDAEGEFHRLTDHGFAPPPTVHLSRKVASGETVRFSVVRASPEAMPEGRVQFVQHLAPEVIWRPEHLGHANGVVKLAAVLVVAADPVADGARWAEFTALLPRPTGGYVHLASHRGDILLGKRGQWQELLGTAPPAPGIAGYALECRDARALAARCSALGLRPRMLRDDLYAAPLPAALGGAFVFGTRESLGLEQA